jgi:hypothetical protein
VNCEKKIVSILFLKPSKKNCVHGVWDQGFSFQICGLKVLQNYPKNLHLVQKKILNNLMSMFLSPKVQKFTHFF